MVEAIQLLDTQTEARRFYTRRDWPKSGKVLVATGVLEDVTKPMGQALRQLVGLGYITLTPAGEQLCQEIEQ